ncbi:unnamed protein product [Dracunculus medinensis]|uniref:Protein RFT1 homolog n=1 Tax=Dracunculus medinensis TaxID=318479 RepID=A0A158Q3X4_DRAME|nr:unnamed protein product [Dracunculus medinensis]
MGNRRKVILYVGPFLSASFLLIWFPWGVILKSVYIAELHLLCSLFVYNSFFSFIKMAWCALFAESTKEHSRVAATKYSQMAILLSVNIIAITELISAGLTNFVAFQRICVAIFVLCWLCFCITGSLNDNLANINPSQLSLNEDITNKTHVFKISKQIIFQSEFLLLVLTAFLHNCRSMAHLNFASISAELLIPANVMGKGSWSMSSFFAFCTLVPQILVAEFIDDDKKRFSRRKLSNVIFRKAMSSVIYSLETILVKSSTSITPVLIVYFLNQSGYKVCFFLKKILIGYSLINDD